MALHPNVFRAGPFRLLLLVTVASMAVSCSDERREPAPAASATRSAAGSVEAITGSRAVEVVRQHLLAQRVYPEVTESCLNLASHGERNGGWVIAAFDGCSLTEQQTHRLLGEWHVESATLRVTPLRGLASQ